MSGDGGDISSIIQLIISNAEKCLITQSLECTLVLCLYFDAGVKGNMHDGLTKFE